MPQCTHQSFKPIGTHCRPTRDKPKASQSFIIKAVDNPSLLLTSVRTTLLGGRIKVLRLLDLGDTTESVIALVPNLIFDNISKSALCQVARERVLTA